MKKNIIAIIVIVVVGAGSFYGGFALGKTKAPIPVRGVGNFAAGQGRGQGGAGFAGRADGAALGATSSGEVLSKDAASLTIKLRDGGSKIIFFSNSTQIMKTVNGSSNDLIVGQAVTAVGQTNSDGSITAQNIQIRPVTTTLR